MIRLIFIAVVLLIIGGAYLGYTNPSVLPGPLQSLTPVIKSTVDTGLNSAKNILSSTQDAHPAVMGVKTEATSLFKEDTKGKTVQQKAIEFTQYQYCKVIVKTYEEEHNNSSDTPTETPAPEED